MSQLLISQYLNQLSSLKKVSGSQRESVLREAFKDLLKAWGRQHDLTFIPEYALDTLTKDKRYVDGALLYSLRVPFGYWEAKDTKDDLDAEIEKKFKRGYPQDNIIFDDTVTAVLIQNKREVMRADVENVEQLAKLLKLFFSYERAEISQFNKAVVQFKVDLPAVLEALRGMIEAAYKVNKKFVAESARFLAHAQEAINPSLVAADVREMLIQHILTEEIFATVFPNSSFHRENNIARELYKMESIFFTGNTKSQSLKVAPVKLNRIDTPDEKSRKNAGKAYVPKAMLKADKEAGCIALDTETTLSGIPAEAWEYKLGNRSALEWILDQYKEKKPKDPTIREKFGTYCFADYKEKVIDLLMRVTTVSVRTQEIVGAMKAGKR